MAKTRPGNSRLRLPAVSSGVFVCAMVIDCVFGDPEWLPHPVRVMGWAANRLERILRRRRSRPGVELARGALLTVTVISGSVMVARSIGRMRQGNAKHMRGLEVYLASSCLALRNLLEEATKTIRLARPGDLAGARRQLARIVGRDTEYLSPSEVSRAIIETLAESLCDGVVAPMFYLAVGGVPAAIGYKAINTLDSMIGHRDERYLHFGRVAARLDDLANFVPSRLAAGCLVVSALVTPEASASHALATWWADRAKHASPNAGQTEAAMAGALRVRLGGANTYGGERVESPVLGSSYRAPGMEDARCALWLTAMAGCIAAASFWLLLRKREGR